MYQSTAVRVDAMLEDLRTLVEVESPSRDLDALNASAHAVAAVIENRLGGRAVLVESQAGPHVHWSGGGDPRVLILGHHDTVFPLGTLERRPFRVEGGHATGPGVFDMLGGLVQAVHGLAAHAGLEPEAGVNALVEAAYQVLDIAALSRPEIGTTVTPTVASAGTSDNVVPAEATVLVDVRVESAREKERVESAMAALAPHLDEAEIVVRGPWAGPRCRSRRRRNCSRWRGDCCRASGAGRWVAAATATSRARWGAYARRPGSRRRRCPCRPRVSGGRRDGRAGASRHRTGERDPRRRNRPVSRPVTRG